MARPLSIPVNVIDRLRREAESENESENYFRGDEKERSLDKIMKPSPREYNFKDFFLSSSTHTAIPASTKAIPTPFFLRSTNVHGHHSPACLSSAAKSEKENKFETATAFCDLNVCTHSAERQRDEMPA